MHDRQVRVAQEVARATQTVDHLRAADQTRVRVRVHVHLHGGVHRDHAQTTHDLAEVGDGLGADHHVVLVAVLGVIAQERRGGLVEANLEIRDGLANSLGRSHHLAEERLASTTTSQRSRHLHGVRNCAGGKTPFTLSNSTESKRIVSGEMGETGNEEFPRGVSREIACIADGALPSRIVMCACTVCVCSGWCGDEGDGEFAVATHLIHDTVCIARIESCKASLTSHANHQLLSLSPAPTCRNRPVRSHRGHGKMHRHGDEDVPSRAAHHSDRRRFVGNRKGGGTAICEACSVFVGSAVYRETIYRLWLETWSG